VSKVFGIGFHKTGTTSLAEALRMLGRTVTGPNGVNDPNIARNALPLAMSLVGKYDAFQDNPWPLLFRELDARIPGSRFILTVRSEEAWLRSVVAHFGNQDTPMRRWIYGVGHPLGHEDIYLDRYRQHNRDVVAHFASRPSSLLVMDVAGGDGWEKLCPFLGLPEPAQPFPHANKAGARIAPLADGPAGPQGMLRRAISALRQLAR